MSRPRRQKRLPSKYGGRTVDTDIGADEGSMEGTHGENTDGTTSAKGNIEVKCRIDKAVVLPWQLFSATEINVLTIHPAI